ncbi:MAG: hypothetical protein NTW21_44830 [Verrucomicrobia bacterium]|nr:hypothetical protein [Verrucomicrobiota bacterium]
MTTPSTIPPAMTESQALRACDLPATKRQWLREQIPSVEVGGGRIYDARQVTELRLRLDQAALTNRAVQIPSGNVPLFTR